jgi:chitodextrinase
VGVSGYQVFQNGIQIATTTVTNFSSTGLQPLTTYTYQVKAFDGAGNLSAFSNQAQATTPDLTFSFTSGPVVSVKGATSATVSWSTSKPGNGAVDYGLTTAFGSSVGDSAFLGSHTVTLSNLQAGKTYYFRVKSVTPDGTQIVSTVSSFKTRRK